MICLCAAHITFVNNIASAGELCCQEYKEHQDYGRKHTTAYNFNQNTSF
jgi:hypothetical protein